VAPVEGDPGPVVSDRGTGIGVGGGLLDIPERYASVEGCVMNAWRRVCGPMGLVIPAQVGDPSDDSRRAATTRSLAVRVACGRSLLPWDHAAAPRSCEYRFERLRAERGWQATGLLGQV
jgi:hypothetical protein